MKSPCVPPPDDLLTNRNWFSLGSLDFPLFLHEDVVEPVCGQTVLRRLLALVLLHLAVQPQ